MVVVNAKPAAKINVRDRYARSFNAGHKLQHSVHRIQIGLGGGDLRADVAVNANDAQSLERSRMLVNAQSVFVGDAKLVALQARRNIRMRFRVHIRVDANADRGGQAHAKGDGGQHVQLGLALNVKAANACAQGLCHLGAGFAHA